MPSRVYPAHPGFEPPGLNAQGGPPRPHSSLRYPVPPAVAAASGARNALAHQHNHLLCAPSNCPTIATTCMDTRSCSANMRAVPCVPRPVPRQVYTSTSSSSCFQGGPKRACPCVRAWPCAQTPCPQRLTCQYLEAHRSMQLFSPTLSVPSLYLQATRSTDT